MCKQIEFLLKRLIKKNSSVFGWFLLYSLAAFVLWCITLLSLACLIPCLKGHCSWLSTAGSFGDMFGCLTCLFAGFSVAGLIVTLRQQAINIRQQQIESYEMSVNESSKLLQNERLFVAGLITQVVETKRNLVCESAIAGTPDVTNKNKYGDEVTRLLLDETNNMLKRICNYSTDCGKASLPNDEFIIYTEKLKIYLGISSMVYFILRYIKNSKMLSNHEKHDLTIMLIFSLSPADKQLLNIVFLRGVYGETISHYSYLFNEEQTFAQLKSAISQDEYARNVNDEHIRVFIEAMKADLRDVVS